MHETDFESVRKNVLHLIPSFRSGGSERQAVQLVKRMADDGRHNVVPACLDRDGPLLSELGQIASGDIPEFALDSFYDARMARQLSSFVKYLRKKKIDIVQSHDFYTNIFGMLGARLARVPVRIAAKRETGMRSKAQLFAERRAIGLATAIVANSASVKEYLIGSSVPERKIEVIHNGLDLRRFEVPTSDRAAILADLGLPADPDLRFVTIVANLRDPVKDQETFLEAAKIVSGRNAKAVFVLAGEGPRTDMIENLAERIGIGEKVHFLGRCDRVPELLSVSAIGVLTSRSEGFSNSILEYMAAGLPVVATRVGGAAEAVIEGKTGYLIEPGDNALLASRLVEILQNDELATSMGAKGRKRASEHFSIEAQLAKTHKLYERELERISAKKNK
ncbi:MAG: glycosyltransferase [Pyrinomonadaceae bacterium]